MNVWDLIILQPMINILIALSDYLFNNFGITIIALTIIIRFCMLPLSVKQLRATKAMSSLQPKLIELQKKYAKDRSKLAQEQMRMYKESGISPMGCMVPMLVQMPIWIALYQSIILTLAISPEGLLNLSRYFYPWPQVYSLVPLGNQFLWLDLATGDTLMAILVGATMWFQQKMVTPTAADPRAQAQSRMMLWMMPLMFGFLCLSFPSGLSLYWLVSNVITVVIQYYITGLGGLSGFLGKKQVTTTDKRIRKHIAYEEAEAKPVETSTDTIEPSSTQKEDQDDERYGDKRQDSGGSYPTRPRTTRYQPRRDRDNRPKRR
ncbi:YidC/Oxa1 family membrane protein insertase [Chloroflexota bacterium]